MKSMTVLSLAVTLMGLVLLSAILWATVEGQGWAELMTLLAYPWFKMSLLDVYVGFILFCFWIVYRETRFTHKLLWVVGMMLLGNLLACIYVLLAIRQAQGDWTIFWQGRHSTL